MTTLRFPTALPADGVFDPAPIEDPIPIPKPARVTIVARYTLSEDNEASGDGFARLRPEFKIGERWMADPAVLSSSVVGGYQRNVLGGSEHSLPSPTLDVIDFAVPIAIPDGASHVRCPSAEAGDTSYPGTLDLVAVYGKG